MVLVVLTASTLAFTAPQPIYNVAEVAESHREIMETTTPQKIDCYCTDRTGDRREMGELVCLDVGGRLFTARCEMSLNNPMWREISDGCVSASLNKTLDRG